MFQLERQCQQHDSACAVVACLRITEIGDCKCVAINNEKKKHIGRVIVHLWQATNNKEGVSGSHCCKGRCVFWTLCLAAPCEIVSLFRANGIMTDIASRRIQTVIVQSPGKMTRSTLGSASRYLAAAMAFLKCCSILRCNVFSPRLHR